MVDMTLNNVYAKVKVVPINSLYTTSYRLSISGVFGGGGLRLLPLQPTVIFMIVFLAVLLIFKKKNIKM